MTGFSGVVPFQDHLDMQLGSLVQRHKEMSTINLRSAMNLISLYDHIRFRLLVPPGFTNNILDKSFSLKSSIHPPLSEVEKPITRESLFHAGAKSIRNGTHDNLERKLSLEKCLFDGQPEDETKHALLLNKGENINFHSTSNSASYKLAMENELHQNSRHVDAREILGGPEMFELNAKLLEDKIVDAKTMDDIRSGRPSDLLSLIVSGDKGRYQISGFEIEDKPSDDFTHKSSQYTNEISEQLGIGNKKEIVPAVLTCEDLEQSILSEYSAETSNVQPSIQCWSTTSANTERPRDHVGDHASGHLLSLLQKGTDPSNLIPNSSMDLGFSGKLLVSEERNKGNAVNEPKGEVGTKNIDNLGKTRTMEAFFGSAFMKDLQSVDAPVSIHRGVPVESMRTDAPESHGLFFPIMDNDIFSLGVDQTILERTNHDSSTLISNQRKQTKPGKGENWLEYDDSQIDSSHHTEAVFKRGGFDGVVEFQLPEEESLISVGNQNHSISTFIPSSNSGKNDFFLKRPSKTGSYQCHHQRQTYYSGFRKSALHTWSS
ncbi:Hypothetical predicted protein [Olea europaea subsp. europaea]|uniref:Uncharacterized protein n=1 Tax=Olea europaea subsp. europaea TaxID=158383 RepID=A0A8S0U1B6_OLEEU|nr:Hypothetical predicted protein [Olea europaea subsp. europaea]